MKRLGRKILWIRASLHVSQLRMVNWVTWQGMGYPNENNEKNETVTLGRMGWMVSGG